MFENLSDKLQRSFKTLRGQGTISDENIADALREIRLALLESDVNLAVVTELIDHIRTRAMAEKIASAPTEAALQPDKQHKREAPTSGCDMLIVDPAGRNQNDTALMDEMAQLKKLLNPSDILFVADAMTGQDAVNSAKAFNNLLTITGAILTKMDSDARGCAALSIRHL